MPFCYSPSRRGFYQTDIHGDMMPSDCITITDAEYAELFRLQAMGHTIVTRNGRPVAEAPAPAPDAPQTVIPSLDFRRSFTDAEKARITLEASRMLEQGDARLQVFMDDVASSGTVNLRATEVVTGIEFLLAKGLITPRRADEILRR